MKSIITAFLFCLFCNTLIAQNQDCNTSIKLLTKDSIIVSELDGSGEVDDNFDTECTFFTPEIHSSWYNFSVFEAGSFNFTIKPTNPTNDIDFYMFKTELDICDLTDNLRCNASSCIGAKGYTGLASNDSDLFENLNCDVGENAYCSEVQLEEGSNYYLMINNFTGNEGYTLVMCGTVKLGPDDLICTDEILDTKEPIEKSYSISPNPTTAYINIEHYHEIESIEVINLQGMLMERITKIKEQLFLDYPAGQYYLKMYTKANEIRLVSVSLVK